MLSPQTLERVSFSYRRGYYDGYFERGCCDSQAPDHPFDRPFAEHDYKAGYEAGNTDALWQKKREAAKLEAQKP